MQRTRTWIIGVGLSGALASAAWLACSRNARHDVRHAQHALPRTEVPAMRAARLATTPRQTTPRPARAAAQSGLHALARIAERRSDREVVRKLYRAEQRVIAACMAERGFQYDVVPLDERERELHALRTLPPDDVERARESGYGLSDVVESAAVPPGEDDANARRAVDLPAHERARYERALLGDPAIDLAITESTADVGAVAAPAGGHVLWDRRACVAEAKRDLYGDDVTEQELAFGYLRVQAALEARVADDPDVRVARERWRGCMSAQGMASDRPGAAANTLFARFRAGEIDLDALRREELTIASADAACYRDAELGPRSEAARARVLPDVEREHGATLASVESMDADALTRAEQLLDEDES